MTDLDKKRWDYAAKRINLKRRTASGGEKPAYTPEQLASDYETIDGLSLKYGTGTKPGASVGAPAGGGTSGNKAATGALMQGLTAGQGGAPARGLQLPTEDRQKIRAAINQGQFGTLLNSPAVRKNTALRNALLREHVSVTGKSFAGGR
jgi:hypothetical protein